MQPRTDLWTESISCRNYLYLGAVIVIYNTRRWEGISWGLLPNTQPS